MFKIIIDANLWISFLVGKKDLKKLCFDENISIIACPKIVEEFIGVSSREKVKKYIKQQNISDILNLIKVRCVADPVENTVMPGLRDPDDLYLLALADAVNADFLLTGDKDLLVLKQHNQTKIISYSDFMVRLE
jgi:putative PIN family toxin of toxin-antitoxin system